MTRLFTLLAAGLFLAVLGAGSAQAKIGDKVYIYTNQGWYGCTLVTVVFIGKDNALHSYKWGNICPVL